jgi:hypothetical protein
MRCSGSQQLQYISHADPKTPDARAAAALAIFDGNAL